MSAHPTHWTRWIRGAFAALLLVGWPLVGQTEPVPPGGDQGIFAQATGEAAIINGDVPSARLEAIARAKWAAIEQAVGVQVKSQSLVQNAMLGD